MNLATTLDEQTVPKPADDPEVVATTQALDVALGELTSLEQQWGEMHARAKDANLPKRQQREAQLACRELDDALEDARIEVADRTALGNRAKQVARERYGESLKPRWRAAMTALIEHHLRPAYAAQALLIRQLEHDVANGAPLGSLPTLPSFFLPETATITGELTGVIREAQAAGFYTGDWPL